MRFTFHLVPPNDNHMALSPNQQVAKASQEKGIIFPKPDDMPWEAMLVAPTVVKVRAGVIFIPGAGGETRMLSKRTGSDWRDCVAEKYVI